MNPTDPLPPASCLLHLASCILQRASCLSPLFLSRFRQPVFCILTPLPGTDLYEETSHLLTTDDYERFDLSHAVLPTRLPLDRFYASYLNLYRRAYLREGGPRPGSFMSEELMGRVMEEFHKGLSDAALRC